MTDAKLYYTLPSDAGFENMKAAAILIWKQYDDQYGYATEKISRIENMKNIGDNFMYIFAMFDMDNQRILVDRIHPLTRVELRDRLLDGGNSQMFLTMLGI